MSPIYIYIARICPPVTSIYIFIYYLLMSVVKDLLKRFAESVDYVSEIRAPLNTDGAQPKKRILLEKTEELEKLVHNPAFKLSDLPAYWDALKNMDSVGLDDRQLLLEKVLVLMSRLEHTNLSMKIQQHVIDLLYKDLPHPPSTYLCLPAPEDPKIAVSGASKIKYAFRAADGSNYNPLFPTLGKAGFPYARSVSSTNTAPAHTLPDAGLVFDTLLRRPEGSFTAHPGGISALFFAFADLVIHSIFNTNHTDWTINDASSYLDLSILYGSSDTQVNSVRRHDGSGRLWDDVFADSRLLLMPPAACALLVLLNRNHNYIAQKILDINEHKTFAWPPPTNPADRKLQDDELFHRARLVNCGYFMQIILGDYVGAILGLVRDGSDWRLNPLMNMREGDHEVSPRGQGNVVSVEFNLLYRWHATLSQHDTQWTTEMFDKIFDNKSPDEITIDMFKNAAHAKLIPPADVRDWTFNNLKRNADKRFNDADLAEIIQSSTGHIAGAFQARGTPAALRVIEILGIEQSRSWGVCSMNEFRKFLGLKPYATFKDWNPDPKIHNAAAALYKDIDNLELHVGLQAEQTKEPGPGAGLCPGYTISRAILADAVCLTRGDRFLTVDFTPFNLTSWGYQDCQFDPKDGSYGGLLTKLLFRTLPDQYPAGSAYAHFPFLEPTWMKSHLETTAQHLVSKYIWTPPKQHFSTVVMDSYADVKRVLSDRDFVSVYDERLLTVVKPILGVKISKTELAQGRALVEKLILPSPGHDLGAYFSKMINQLVKDRAFNHADQSIKYIDIVNSVINELPIHWISQELVGLPLKTESNRSGAWYEEDVYPRFADVAQYVFRNSDPTNDWRLREASQSFCKDVANFIEGHFEKITNSVSVSDTAHHLGIENNNCHDFLRRVLEADGGKHSLKELSAFVFTALIPTAAVFSQTVVNAVEFYLRPEQVQAKQEIVKLAGSGDNARIMPYVLEALRLNPPISGVYRTATKDQQVGSITVNSTQRVFASIIKANLDTSAFGPEPAALNITRSEANVSLVNVGEEGLLNAEFFKLTAPAIVGTFLSLKHVQRAPGDSGLLNRFTESWHNCPSNLYVDMDGAVGPWADSLTVQFSSA